MRPYRKHHLSTIKTVTLTFKKLPDYQLQVCS